MRGAFLFAAAVILCPFFAGAGYSDEPIYSNTVGTNYGDATSTKFFDYGITTGGLVKSIRIRYRNDSSVTNWVRMEFYDNYWASAYGLELWGLLRTVTINNLPRTYGGFQVYEYVLPEAERFEIQSGSFGFTAAMSSGIYWNLASGGAGNENEMWEWAWDDWYMEWAWMPIWYGGSPWAGLYLQLIKGPPIDEITCDISGYKFDDADGDGQWDAGEPAMTGWEFYLDTNGDGAYQASEPNVVTDPNGMYFFENLASPATYRVREMMQAGWWQTLPGPTANYEHVIATEPNHVYPGYHFGNTDQAPVKYGGGDGSAGTPYQIKTAAHMNQLGLTPADWNRCFILMNDINMGGIAGTQYNMIGYHNSDTDQAHFTGIFDGNGHTIQNFRCTRGAEVRYVGLFGYTEGAQIFDLTMTNAIVVGGDMVGTLVGLLNGGSISNCHVESSVSGGNYLGGLLGGGNGTVSGCSSSGSITGADETRFFGGLVAFANQATISDCQSTTAILAGNGCDCVGGFVGWQYRGSITDCLSYGAVQTGNDCMSVGGFMGELVGTAQTVRCASWGEVLTGTGCEGVGGLAGLINSGQISQCCSFGNVTSPSSVDVGGFAGRSIGDLLHCYSRSNIIAAGGSDQVGGFIGTSFGSVQCCYSTGEVAGDPVGGRWGGFIGLGHGANNSFWDVEASGLTSGVGGKGRTTAQMKQAATYFHWNKPGAILWKIQEGADYPRLAWEGLAGTNLPTSILTDYLDGQGTSVSPYLIESAADLDLIGLFPEEYGKSFKLTADLDLSGYQGTEFNLIGFHGYGFGGHLDGNGHRIHVFTYSTSSDECQVGLFRCVTGTIENLVLEAADVATGGGFSIGGLVGEMSGGSLLGCGVSGTVSAGDGSSDVGGLAGILSEGASADDCRSHTDVTAGSDSDSTGGLFGCLYGGSLSNSCHVGSVTVGDNMRFVGGLLGSNEGGAVDSCFSLGSVTAGNTCQYVGGLMGYAYDTNNCYSRAAVTVGDSCQYIGGLNGRANHYVRYCYSAGAVSTGLSASQVGGLIGYATSTSWVQYSYWDTQTSGRATSSGGMGRVTSQMQQAPSFGGWNFGNMWAICGWTNYPRLQWQIVPADFACPDGVGMEDLGMLADDWLASGVTACDIAPAPAGDGVVNLVDFAAFAGLWMEEAGL